MSGQSTLAIRLGRPRFGGGPALLLILSAVAGLLISVAIGFAAARFRPDDPTATIVLIFAVTCFPVGAALAWTVLVDRRSLPSATGRPEDTIERHWADIAARGAFLDLLIFCGLGATALAVTGVEFQAHAALTLAIALGGADFWARYQLQRRANS